MIDLIPIGAENAVLLKDLAAKVGKSPRQVQADIQSIREKDQINIISLATGGYCLPSNDDKGEREAIVYEAMMIRQAVGRLQKARISRQWREERGQIRFFMWRKLDEIENLLLLYLSEDVSGIIPKEGEE
jgi:biotin operon repressor